MKYNRLFAALAATFISLGLYAQNPREFIQQDLTRTAGYYHAYEAPEQVAKPDVPKGYKPFYISHYGRHGCRWLISDKRYTGTLETLEKAGERNLLTATGKRLLEDMRVIAEDARDRYGELTPKGARTHKGIAERMYNSYPEVFRPGAKIDTKSTIVVRCVLSMAAFDERLKELEPALDITRESSQRTMCYMSNSRGRGIYKEEVSRKADSLKHAYLSPDRFMNSVFIGGADAVKDLVKKDYGFMYDCYEIASNMQDVEYLNKDLYYLFTQDELYSMWKYMNARSYMYMGPSQKYGDTHLEDARPLLRNIVETAEDVISGKSDVSASLRFGHDSNIIPLMSLMQVEKAARRVPVTEAEENWNITKVSSMATNLQFIFFRNKAGDIIVRVLHNETDAVLPVAGGPYYKWEDLRTYLKSRYE